MTNEQLLKIEELKNQYEAYLKETNALPESADKKEKLRVLWGVNEELRDPDDSTISFIEFCYKTAF